MNETAKIVVLAALSLVLTRALIPAFLPKLLKANLGGFDLNKPRENQKEKTPEAAGIVSLLSFTIFTPLLAGKYRVPIVCAGLLGFVDNVTNLEWRWKLLIPFISLLEMSLFQDGIRLETPFFDVQLPQFVQVPILICFTIFCQNSINIYAGINGLEIGQSIVLMTFLFFYNYLNDSLNADFLQISLVFMAVSLPLLHFNKYPARAFVGDVYTYFAGAAYAAAALSSNSFVVSCFLLFMQIINFVASLPQLLGVVECPRHRLLRLQGNLLYGQKKNWNVINQYLLKVRRRGMSEAQLLKELVAIQAIGSALIIVAAVYMQ